MVSCISIIFWWFLCKLRWIFKFIHKLRTISIWGLSWLRMNWVFSWFRFILKWPRGIYRLLTSRTLVYIIWINRYNIAFFSFIILITIIISLLSKWIILGIFYNFLTKIFKFLAPHWYFILLSFTFLFSKLFCFFQHFFFLFLHYTQQNYKSKWLRINLIE